MRSTVVDQSLSKIQYGGQSTVIHMICTSRSFSFQILFKETRRRLSNDANGIELLHSKKKKMAFECFFPSVTNVAKIYVIMDVPRSCRRLGTRNTRVGGTRYGTLT